MINFSTEEKLQSIFDALYFMKTTYQESYMKEMRITQNRQGKLRMTVKRESIEYREFNPIKDE